MLPRTYAEENCPVAGTLEVVGERWTLLILRDAFLGVRRFDDFQARLEMSRNVLSRRLADLVEAGLLRREPYQQRPTRYDYLPTEKALELWPVLAGLAQWGGSHAAPPAGTPREFAHAACGTAAAGRGALPALRRRGAAGGGGEPPGAGLPARERGARAPVLRAPSAAGERAVGSRNPHQGDEDAYDR